MEFHVAITIRLPGDMPAGQRADVLAAELRRGRELRDAGTIARIWRVPGALRNIGVWHAPDAGALHEAIASLPCFPWLESEVVALAPHPVEVGDDA
jgi:muconolactone D-isomerase